MSTNQYPFIAYHPPAKYDWHTCYSHVYSNYVKLLTIGIEAAITPLYYLEGDALIPDVDDYGWFHMVEVKNNSHSHKQRILLAAVFKME